MSECSATIYRAWIAFPALNEVNLDIFAGDGGKFVLVRGFLTVLVCFSNGDGVKVCALVRPDQRITHISV